MTENMKIAMSAINKWFYYAMNYKVVEIEVKTFDGIKTMMLPDFFNALPMGIRMHFAEKWNADYDSYGSRAVLMAFYGEVSSEYRKAIMQWVMENYHDEVKLNFNEEED
jgi:hypothetical protein